MKQLLIFVCIALFMCSCNALKKTSNSNHVTHDSTGTKSSTIVELKKKDSTGTDVTQATEKKKSESGYKKTTTTIVEYFSDEFGDEDDTAAAITKTRTDPADYFPPDTSQQKINPGLQKPAKKPGNLLKRETTRIEEEGFKNDLNEAAMTNTKTAQLNSNDSLRKDDNQTTNTSSTQDQKQDTKAHLSLLPWYVWLFLILVIVGALYLKIKFS